MRSCRFERSSQRPQARRRGCHLRLSGAMMAAAVAVLLILGTGAAQPAQAQVESVIHSFTGPTSDGLSANAVLIRDSSGNLYSTTYNGGSSTNCGTYGCGTVFELVYDSSTNSYTEKVLYNFTGSDGAGPWAGLIRDSSGNLFGTTINGGSSTNCGSNGCGTAFELVYDSSTNSYTEKVLYNFTGSDGALPRGGLIMDSAGNLFGTTVNGGSTYVAAGGYWGDGTVFELSPDASSSTGYSEKVLHSFTRYNTTTPASSDGAAPYGGLMMDPAGNLYGTTMQGGSASTVGDGTVFELKKTATGYSSTDTVLINFTGANGQNPYAGLMMDPAGNLYGTTSFGGASDGGTVFKVSPDSSSSTGYSVKVLLSFSGYLSPNGALPEAGLMMDSAGNLYGTTEVGGSSTHGIVFELSPDASSSTGYSEKVLHNFTGSGGYGPVAGLIMDSMGNLYGTTAGGGSTYAPPSSAGDGTVFGVAPVTLSTTSLSFGSVQLGTTSASQSVTLTNYGGGSLSYGTPSISGTNAGDFSIATNTCTTVAANSTCSVSVTFTPGTATAETAALNLVENGLTQTVNLTGTGASPTATLSPNLTFPDTLVGTSSASQTVTLTNTSASAVLTIDSINVSANFTQTSTTCGASLAAGTSCTIDVAFSPTTTGSLTGTLTVTDNTSSGSQSVTLAGASLTTVQYIQDVMIPQVESLGLKKGQTNSLVKELNQAAKMISEGKINGAISNLEQFIAEVNDLAGSGVLSPTQASMLIGEANSVIKQL